MLTVVYIIRVITKIIWIICYTKQTILSNISFFSHSPNSCLSCNMDFSGMFHAPFTSIGIGTVYNSVFNRPQRPFSVDWVQVHVKFGGNLCKYYSATLLKAV